MSDPVKKLVKGVGKIFKPVLKAFKKNPILAIAAIYFTGGAVGLWSTPFTGAAAGTAASSGLSAGTGAAGVATGVTVPTAATIGTNAVTAANTALSTTAASTATTAATSYGVLAPTVLPGTTIAGSLSTAAKSVLGYIGKNPGVGLIAGQMLSSAFTPTQAEQQAEIEANRRKNSNYYGVGGTDSSGPGSSVEGLFTAVRRPRAPQTPGLISGAMTGGR